MSDNELAYLDALEDLFLALRELMDEGRLDRIYHEDHKRLDSCVRDCEQAERQANARRAA
jgi:hypothetical protein